MGMFWRAGGLLGLHSITLSGRASNIETSSLLREDDAEYHALTAADLFWSANVSTTVGRDHIVNLVIGDRYPFAVHFDFVVIANHSTLGRATIHQVAAGTLAIISFELRVKVLMPVIVAYSVIAVLRRRADAKKHG
jgi:hypothetical protein